MLIIWHGFTGAVDNASACRQIIARSQWCTHWLRENSHEQCQTNLFMWLPKPIHGTNRTLLSLMEKCVSPSGFPLNRPMETPRHVHVHVRSCQFSQGSTPTQCRVATLSGTLKLCSWVRWYGASKISFSKTIRNSTSWWVQLLQYVVYCLFGMMMPIVFFGGDWLLLWTW